MIRTAVFLITLALFISACSSSNVVADLYSTEWQVSSLLGKSLDENATGVKLPTINFGDNNKLFGSTGCNNYIGSFNLKGNSLSLEPGALTKMICPDSPEQEFLSSVRQVTNLKFEGSTLLLLNGAKTVMSLIPKSK